jgi:SH3-like domain-containing protein
MMRAVFICLFIAGLLPAAPAWAQTCDTFSGLPVPRFVSLRFDEAAGRSGPSEDHAIAWMYQRAGLPLQVIAETPDWRRVRDPGGEEVWMHRRLLSGRRAVRALAAADMLARPETDSALIARIEPGAVLWLERCRAGWCRLEADGRRGWVGAEGLWGVYSDEADPTGALEGGERPCYRSAPELAEDDGAQTARSPAR